MAKTQFAVELGMGTDLRGEDYTKAACKAVRDAIHRNFLNLSGAFGLPRKAMIIDVRIGVQNPGAVRKEDVARELPYGVVQVESVFGGMNVDMEGTVVVVANAIVAVSYDIEQEQLK